ncbi:hypothetical protein OC835_007775, partial [Tilletia horrida]
TDRTHTTLVPAQPQPSAIAVRTPFQSHLAPRTRLSTEPRRGQQSRFNAVTNSSYVKLDQQQLKAQSDNEDFEAVEDDEEDDELANWSTLWVGSGTRLPRQVTSSPANKRARPTPSRNKLAHSPSAHAQARDARAKLARLNGQHYPPSSSGTHRSSFDPARQVLAQLHNQPSINRSGGSGGGRGGFAEASPSASASASGGTIRLSSTFTLPSLPLRVRTSTNNAAADAATNRRGSKEMQDGPSSTNGRMGSSQASKQGQKHHRLAFAPTPLERWKAE